MINEQFRKLIHHLIQLQDESSAFYLAMASYMNELNLKGMESWFKFQSEKELEHMVTLRDYLINSGETVGMNFTTTKHFHFGSPLESFQNALKHEDFVSDSYRKAFSTFKQIKLNIGYNPLNKT